MGCDLSSLRLLALVSHCGRSPWAVVFDCVCDVCISIYIYIYIYMFLFVVLFYVWCLMLWHVTVFVEYVCLCGVCLYMVLDGVSLKGGACLPLIK